MKFHNYNSTSSTSYLILPVDYTFLLIVLNTIWEIWKNPKKEKEKEKKSVLSCAHY